MNLTTVTPKKSINKAFLKERVSRADIEQFKAHFALLLDRIQAVEHESEENRKNSVADFLKVAHFTPQYEINTKGREDLVIHTGKTAKDSVGVVFEIKKPDSSEMMSAAKPNTKALQQLVFYYLRERIEHKNLDIKHLIATDIFNWFIFDENLFDKHIYRNPKFQKGYETFKQSGKDTAFFYNEVAKPLLDELDVEWECTHFNLKTYEKTVKNDDLTDDTPLIALYKILSPTHLLKLPFANDSNSLDKGFYTELLHIIGLEEIKDGSKKIINRKARPDEFSLLENTLTKIENKGFADVSNLSKLGSSRAEQTFSIALELCITWVNRILFLKLLEAQLVSYHKGDKAYRFLNPSVIYDCDRLNKLFFEVLAEKPENRKGKVKAEFERIPYLNSSLFERTDLERKTIEINYLDDNEHIPILANTVLKDDKGKKRSGSLPTLLYLFEFLDAFDFASEGTEGIQDDKRTLINASVLGLIFEKINGYKDGSFFTPGFITMYMCRETIRRAVVQKFRDTGLQAFANLDGFDDLKDAITDRQQANDIINALKICDPAVGSGHFLVSALNEIIALKSDLGVLSHRDGSRVKHYKVEIQNDELIVTDEEKGDIFQYFVNAQGVAPREVQQLQETLFHEKQLLIENCLFGVDINPNSVKICRLRLWIELLKNAFYITPSVSNHLITNNSITNNQLETLPNIDINIKQGNSLISRFKLDDDLSDVFKKQKFSYTAYRKAVEDYKNTNSKEAKTELQTFISDIKEQFQTVFHAKIKENKELSKFKGQLYNLQNQGDLFGGGVDKVEEDRLEKLVAQYEQKVKDIKGNIIYRDAFEWRFEFPEVLDNEGGYVGFDVVIGNPPYVRIQDLKDYAPVYKTFYQSAETGNYDIYVLFIEKGISLIKPNGNLNYILPHKFIIADFGKGIREILHKNKLIEQIISFGHEMIFEDASTYTCLLSLSNKLNTDIQYVEITPNLLNNDKQFYQYEYANIPSGSAWVFTNSESASLIEKLESMPYKLETVLDKVFSGIQTSADNIYSIIGYEKEGFIYGSSKSGIENIKIEKGLLKPLIKGDNIKRYAKMESNVFVIFPYVLENGEAIPMSESLIKSNFKEGYNYLKKFENELRNRESGKMNIDDKWFLYNYPKNLYLSNQKKLVSPDITFPMNITTENGSFCLKNGAYGITLKKDFEHHEKMILALLNSKLLWHFLQNTGNVLRGGYFRFNTKYIMPFPIPDILKIESRQIETLVEEIIAMKKATPSVSTAEKEAEIDRLVYGLYGLTAEEINIIENSIK